MGGELKKRKNRLRGSSGPSKKGEEIGKQGVGNGVGWGNYKVSDLWCRNPKFNGSLQGRCLIVEIYRKTERAHPEGLREL